VRGSLAVAFFGSFFGKGKKNSQTCFNKNNKDTKNRAEKELKS
jgi:hypothetical protein